MLKIRTFFILHLPVMFFALCLILANSNVFAGGNDSALVKIEWSKPEHNINPTMFCSNLLWYQEKDEDWNGEGLGKLFRENGFSMLRYPGGEVVSKFHWKNPKGGGWKDSWDPKYIDKPVDPSEWMGLDEYLDIVEQHGFTPLVGVNMESGMAYGRLQDSLDEAKELVLHLLKRGISLYYYLDNESYHHNSHYRMTPKEYGIVSGEFGKMIKALDPKAKIVLNWKSTWKAGWSTVLKHAGEVIDVVDLHAYWSNMKGNKASWDRWVNQNPLIHGKGSYYKKIKTFRNGLNRLGYPQVEIGFYEWGQGRVDAKAHISMAQTGLINAELMMDFIRAGTDHACIWPIRPFASKGKKKAKSVRGLITTPENQPTGSFQTLSSLSDLSNFRFVKSWARSKSVKTIAAVDGDKILVYLLNKSDAAETVELSLPRESGAWNKGNIRSLSLPGDGIHKTTLISRTVAMETPMDPVELLPWSLTQISFKRAGVDE